MEYINALVNFKSPDALQVVSGYIKQFEKGEREVKTNEDADFYAFLFRRMAFLYIEFRRWDSACHLLNQLLESPMHDFAVEELAYLDRISK